MKHLRIVLYKLRNPELLQYMKDYLLLLDHNDTALLHIAPEYALLMSKVDQMEAVLKQDLGSDYTPLINKLDKERDRYLVGIGTTISGLCNHFDPAKSAAALVLKDRMNVYGKASEISKQSLQGTTATIKNLVIDLQTIPAYSTALTTLSLTDWIAELKVVNNELMTQYFNRTEEIAARNPDKMKQLRREAYPLYYRLRDLLMAQGLVAAYASPFPKAINEVNALTEQYNVTLAQRVGYADHPADSESPPDEMEPLDT